MKINAVAVVLCLVPSLCSAVEGFYKIPDSSQGVIQSRADRSVLYKYTRNVTQQGDLRVARRHYESPDGKPAATETVTYKDGRVVKMVWEQFQINESGQFEIKDGKVLFSHTVEGKEKTDVEKLEDNFVSQDEVVEHVFKNWDAISKGESIHIRLPVIFRRETIGFKLFKDSETSDGIKIVMKPSSFVIAALVKPLMFLFKKDGDHRLINVDGRVTPKILEGGKWKDLDALFVMQY